VWSTRFGQNSAFALPDLLEWDSQVEGLHIVGTFVLQYEARFDEQLTLIDEPIEVASADVVAFATFNATFNAWPYWREFVQSMTSRMGLPSVVIPVLPVPNLIGGNGRRR